MKSRLVAIAVTVTALISFGQVKAAVIPVKGKCNIARAIIAANEDRPVVTCPAGRGADVIVLRQRQHYFPLIANARAGTAAYPPITSTITIQGRQARILGDYALEPFQFFKVLRGGHLTLGNIQLIFAPGDAIEVHGRLTLRNGTGLYQSDLCGFYAAPGSIVVADSVGIASNLCGIAAVGARISVANSDIWNNDNPEGLGGGVFLKNSTLTLINSRIDHNHAFNGGGVALLNSTLVLSGSIIELNTPNDLYQEGASAVVTR